MHMMSPEQNTKITKYPNMGNMPNVHKSKMATKIQYFDISWLLNDCYYGYMAFVSG